MPVPAGGTEIPVIADATVSSITLTITRANAVSVDLVKPTGYGKTTDLTVGYVDEGTTISYTTSAKPGGYTLHVSEWYADGSHELAVVVLAPEEVYTVPENVIQIGLYYGS